MRPMRPVAFALLMAALPGVARAHFQEILPSADILTAESGGKVSLDLVFTHPMAGGPAMEMAPPAQFGVIAGGKKQDLKNRLAPRPVDGKAAYRAEFEAKQPGDHIFFVEPAPYYEPSEKKMIVHYAKVVVDFFEEETGWDSLVGLPVEIKPLSRPYGLWTGNSFRGVVLRAGKPVPNAEIEVEWVNDGSVKAPNAAFVTQVVKADAAGVFSYTMPRAGWWGFAALVEGDKPMKGPDGKEAAVELGGLIWVKAVDMK